VDIEGVRFSTRVDGSVSILHCSPYIREWMLQERGSAERAARTVQGRNIPRKHAYLLEVMR